MKEDQCDFLKCFLHSNNVEGLLMWLNWTMGDAWCKQKIDQFLKSRSSAPVAPPQFNRSLYVF